MSFLLFSKANLFNCNSGLSIRVSSLKFIDDKLFSISKNQFEYGLNTGLETSIFF